MDYSILLDLALILFLTKFLGILMRKLGLPQVVGALLAGIILGPMALGLVDKSEGITLFAEIGVIMLLFSAGLNTNIKEIKSNGKASFFITILGVIIPLGIGILVAALFNGGFNVPKEKMLQNIYIGILLTATSVGITVETLKEMGRLKGKVGTSLLSAAILDDIIGIVILTIVIGVNKGDASIGSILLKVLFFFVLAGGVGVLIHYLLKLLSKRFEPKRRLPIYSLAICFLFSYVAEAYFSIADITGAYIAGVVMSSLNSTEYVERKIDINSYMIFSPIFFASIGLGANFQWSDFNANLILFSLVFVVAGLAGKIIGCTIGAKISGYSWIDSLRVGVGMMARGEVMLVMASKGMVADIHYKDPATGLDVKDTLFKESNLPAGLLLVISSSLITPILMKLLYKRRAMNEFEKAVMEKKLEEEKEGIVSTEMLKVEHNVSSEKMLEAIVSNAKEDNSFEPKRKIVYEKAEEIQEKESDEFSSNNNNQDKLDK